MSNALAVIAPHESRGLSIQEMSEISDVFVKSGFFSDLKSQAQAVVKIMAGQELGLEPFSAMAELHVIQGKITMSAGLLAKKVKQSGKYDYRVREQSDKSCVIEFFQNGQSIGESQFTLEDAKKAQVKNLDKFPRNMLFARAMSNGVRWYCPDVTGSVGVYTEGELDGPLVAEAAIEQATLMADESYVQRITEIATEVNADLPKALKFLRVERLENLTQEQADKLLKQLEAKRDALAAQKPVAAPEPKGLDQWACTQETGSKALAVELLTLCSEAEKVLRLNTEEVKRVIAKTTGEFTSRKDLTAQQVTHAIGALRALIAEETKAAS